MRSLICFVLSLNKSIQTNERKTFFCDETWGAERNLDTICFILHNRIGFMIFCDMRNLGHNQIEFWQKKSFFDFVQFLGVFSPSAEISYPKCFIK